MTEEKLSATVTNVIRRRWGRLLLAAIAIALLGILLFRQPIAEGIGRSICAQQKLNCVIRISRLDLGGLTVSTIEAKNPKSAQAALTATQLAIDFDWGSIFAPRVRRVGGDALTLHLDLSGTRPLLGDLDDIVRAFSDPKAKPGPLPRIELKDVRIVGDTPIGPVEARGHVVATSAEDFTIDMSAPTAKLSVAGADVDLKSGELHAVAKNGAMSGKLSLDVGKFAVGRSSLSDVKVNVSLEQSAGILTGKGAATAQEINFRGQSKVASAEATADIESGAVDVNALTLQRWLPTLRKLNFSATSGAGLIEGMSWKAATASAKLDPKQGGGSSGAAMLSADGITLPEGTADKLDVNLDLDAATTAGAETLSAKGMARLHGASAASALRAELMSSVSTPLESAMPAFASAAGAAAGRAVDRFDVVLPLAGTLTGDGYSVSALSGTQIVAKSGMTLVGDSEGADRLMTWSSGKKTDWTASGSLRLSGGGGPDLLLTVSSAAGDGARLSVAGTSEFKSWRVGEDTFAALAKDLKLETNGAAGAASGNVTAQLTGSLGGGAWTRARASGAMSAVWGADGSFSADAPGGLTLAWDEGRYGEMKIGAGALRFQPTGKLAQIGNGALFGSATVGAFEMPVTGPTFTATAKAGATNLNWTSKGQLKIAYATKPIGVDMKLSDRIIPLQIGDISGLVELSKGWRITGAFKDGTVKAAEANIDGLKAGFDLSGEGDKLDGKLTDVSMRIVDPAADAQRKFEPATFTGNANLANGVAKFYGLFALQRSGVQIAEVAGTHSLKTGEGKLGFAPTPLIFDPKSFQPKALSPLLTGPANVTGRVDVYGGAEWSPKGFKTNATLELKKLGFALASAGVFEGVSGKVVVDDLLAMKSAPGQTITIDKVTLGLPVEKGMMKFQLIGFDAIRFEGAEWPFVGGYLRIKPNDFVFAAKENRVIAQAVDWDLAKLVEQFKINDLKVNGIVSGDFPVVFSTGSARVDKASLSASTNGGVIQYTGSEGASAASADANAKMLFDALKDFRYQVMKVGLDGDLSNRMVLTVNLLGRNPAVLNGKAFDLNISVDSPLAELVSSFNRQVGDYLGLSVNKPEVDILSDKLGAAVRN